jgi:iron complex transport system permease protein
MRAATPPHLGWRWLTVGIAAAVVALVAGVAFGPVSIDPTDTVRELASHLPLFGIRSPLSTVQSTIVMDIRFPRVMLAFLVGAMLAMAGSTYQGVFRNPLADPYLLGAAAGAGLGVTAVIVNASATIGVTDNRVPLAAFAGAFGAVGLAYALARSSGGRSTTSLILAGIAIASFLTAAQTYLQQQNVDSVREVYSWILGRLTTAGWHEVVLILPYFAVTVLVALASRRALDVLAVGEGEATALGMNVRRTRLLLVASASLATAAAVAVSGLIGFVGIVVPHTVRLIAGSSYRRVVPLSILLGGAFLVLADLAARTLAAPSEIPIGVITAVVGAPFFILVLRTSSRVTRT